MAGLPAFSQFLEEQEREREDVLSSHGHAAKPDHTRTQTHKENTHRHTKTTNSEHKQTPTCLELS